MSNLLEKLYMSKHQPVHKILKTGEYLGFKYVVAWFRNHPNAYIEVPKEHPYFHKDYREIDDKKSVNHGFTFSGNLNKEIGVEDGWYIGWDYAHCTDYFRCDDYVNRGHLWDIEEIIDECKMAIEKVFLVNDDDIIHSCKACGGVVAHESSYDIVKYSMNDIYKIINLIKYIDYPPSGRYYGFKDGTTCENWNLCVTLERILRETESDKLVEINEFSD